MPVRKAGPVEVYQIKVTLRDTKPPIWRRLEVKSDMRLSQFHAVLQTVMGWTNSHLHEFQVGEERYGEPMDDDQGEMQDEHRRKLRDVLSGVRSKMMYTYDFGDNWEHVITLEKILPVMPGMKYPSVTGGKRKCPPEDVGGIPGYYRFLAVIRDPKHEEYRDMMEWVGGRYDPDDFSVNDANVDLHGGWSRRVD